MPFSCWVMPFRRVRRGPSRARRPTVPGIPLEPFAIPVDNFAKSVESLLKAGGAGGASEPPFQSGSGVVFRDAAYLGVRHAVSHPEVRRIFADRRHPNLKGTERFTEPLRRELRKNPDSSPFSRAPEVSSVRMPAKDDRLSRVRCGGRRGGWGKGFVWRGALGGCMIEA